MSRPWLTSTTAIALALNTVAPLPAIASQAAVSEGTVSAPKTELRLAQNDASPAAEDVTTGESETKPESEAEAAAQAAETASPDEAAADIPANAGGETGKPAESAAEAEPNDADATVEAPARAGSDAAAEGETEMPAEPEAEAAPQDPAATDNPLTEADVKAAQEAADGAEGTPADDAAQKANTEAAAEAAEDAGAASLADEVPAEPSGEATTPETDLQATPDSGETGGEGDSDDIPEISAEDQASAAAAADENAASAAAASEEGEVVDTQEGTVTEEQSRASNEEFNTTASGEQTTAAPAAKDDDNELLKAVGIAAAAGLGAFAVGKLLDSGGTVVSNTGDRAVVQEPSGAYRIIKDDDILLRRPGAQVQTQTYSDGSTRSTVTEADGGATVTVRAADGRVLRRTRVLADGQNIVLFDDTKEVERVDVSKLRAYDQTAAAQSYDYSTEDVDQLRAALSAANSELPDRSFSLNQIRQVSAVRHLVPVIALDAITFKTGSAVIDAGEAQSLAALGNAMREAIQQDPSQVFLVEGHTDTVGDASYNLALSDRRAESVALALTEYFDVSPANMIVQGYGESDLRVRQTGDLRANRRGAVRNITPLLGAR